MLTDKHINKTMQWTTVGLSVLCIAFVTYALTDIPTTTLEGRLLPSQMRGVIPWKTIFADEVERGVSLPADVNVILHIPAGDDIPRKALFGNSGEDTRYWGYCFPESYEEALRLSRRGFPGRIFLSEAEREARREEERNMRRGKFSALNKDSLTDENLNETIDTRGRIRHQMEIFKAESSCYVMTEAPLPVGADEDGDGVNIFVENTFGSDPTIQDTDGDGLSDGLEIFSLMTSPTTRDSDGDGILDGLEDKNRNGKIDSGETNPLNIDSDRDGLCDGLCRVGSNGSIVRGEDVNLNGQVDDGETDPRKEDSNGNGILDEQEYFNCILNNGATCNYSAISV
ncbi:hypothetical protein KKC44_06245 [Patescibacteria group bacterium]|nr:hypothetical protein [Patescibacteria group bacterium]MBU2260169.1 hypothetical protein [Patescibacteria group bacterium]